MPQYEFENVKNPKKKETFFYSMKDAPRVGAIIKDENGAEWKRIFTVPFASVDSQIDPNNVNDFVEKTGKKKGSYGDLLDASKELSEKRAKQHGGEDPVQKKFFEKYSKERHGLQHLEQKRKKKTDKGNFTVSYD